MFMLFVSHTCPLFESRLTLSLCAKGVPHYRVRQLEDRFNLYYILLFFLQTHTHFLDPGIIFRSLYILTMQSRKMCLLTFQNTSVKTLMLSNCFFSPDFHRFVPFYVLTLPMMSLIFHDVIFKECNNVLFCLTWHFGEQTSLYRSTCFSL